MGKEDKEEYKGLDEPNRNAKYEFKGKYYSLVDLSEILDFNYNNVKSKMQRKNLSYKEAIKAMEEYRSYSFRDQKNLTYAEYTQILAEKTGLSRAAVKARFRSGYSEKEVLNVPPNARKGGGIKKPIKVFKDGEKINEFPTLSEASRELDIPISSLSEAIHKRSGNYKEYKFKLK